MNIILNILNRFILLADIKEKKLLSIIDNDAGLIRYLIQIIREYIFTKNNGGYIQIENKLEGTTLLHRIIFQYYSQFDNKLFEILNNSEYEVNHKNKNVWDNRLENLEIVTKIGNMEHKNNKEYSNEVVFTTNELLNIRERLKNEEQYKKDTNYLLKVNRENNEILKENKTFYKFFNSLYLKFNSITLNNINIPSNITESKQLVSFEYSLFLYVKSNIFCNYTMLVKQYEDYYTKKLLNNNLKLLLKYINKNKKGPLLQILIKYNILNPNITKENIEEFYYHNVLYDLFTNFIGQCLISTINKNNVLVAVSIKDIFITYRIHTTFRIMYYLGLLTRLPTPKISNNWFSSLPNDDKSNFIYGTRNTPSFFSVQRWTNETFIKAEERAERLVEANLTKITYHTLVENFGVEIADEVYKGHNYNISKSVSSTEDVNNILISFKEEIQQNGFIFVEEILEELEFVNEKRKQNGQPFNEIYPECIKFIRTTLQNIPTTKDILKELKVQYTTLNKETMEQIIKHREKNNIQIPLTNEFKSKKQLLVLKKLVRK